MLLPIFGVQFLLHIIPIDSTEECRTGMIALSYIQVIIECFLNKEVIFVLKNLANSHFSSNTVKSNTGYHMCQKIF